MSRIVAKLRYMAKQYAAGTFVRGGSPTKHYLDEAADEIERVRVALGCEGQDSNTDPVAVIEMLRSWEADAQARAEMLEKHLSNVLEIARTWQPDYATKMDRDTLDMAQAELTAPSSARMPLVEASGQDVEDQSAQSPPPKEPTP